MPLFGRGTPTLDSDTDTLTRPVEQEDDGGHNRFAHYIKKEKIVESAVSGKSVRALCGQAAGRSAGRSQLRRSAPRSGRKRPNRCKGL